MKANELRIGNLILESLPFGSDMIIEVDKKTFLRYIGDFEPIPLTGEWLVKLGFEKRDFQYVKFVHEEESDFIGALHDIGFAYYVDKDDERPLIYVKYVHSLQNLYFALTGEELTIN